MENTVKMKADITMTYRDRASTRTRRPPDGADSGRPRGQAPHLASWITTDFPSSRDLHARFRTISLDRPLISTLLARLDALLPDPSATPPAS